MSNHVSSSDLTPTQTTFLHLALDPEECRTSIQHLTNVLKIAATQKTDFEEDLESINWVFHILEHFQGVMFEQ